MDKTCTILLSFYLKYHSPLLLTQKSELPRCMDPSLLKFNGKDVLFQRTVPHAFSSSFNNQATVHWPNQLGLTCTHTSYELGCVGRTVG